jgi:hypothetical protein
MMGVAEMRWIDAAMRRTFLCAILAIILYVYMYV